MKLTLADLPESLHQVVELIGLAATLRLVEHYGGLIKLYVPLEIDPDHHLARNLGVASARKLAVYYGGDELRNIPRCVNGLRRIRDSDIRSRRHEGAARLALEFGLTERQVWTILSEADDDVHDRQSALF